MHSALSTCGKSSASPTPSHCAHYTPQRRVKAAWELYSFLFFCWSCGLGCALRPAPLQCMVLSCNPLQGLLTAGKGFSEGWKVYPPVMGNSDVDLKQFLQPWGSPSQPSFAFGIVMKIRLFNCHINFRHMDLSTTETLCKMHKRQETIDCFWS